MTDKRQLRAEAVERLTSPLGEDYRPMQRLADAIGCYWDTDNKQLSMNRLMACLADLLTDGDTDGVKSRADFFRKIEEADASGKEFDQKADDATPATDTDVPDSGHVRECPQSDAVDVVARIVRTLRHYADALRYDYDAIEGAFIPDEELPVACTKAASMLEAMTNGTAAGTNGIPCAAPLDDGAERTRAEYLGTAEPETSQVPEYERLCDIVEHSLTSESESESECESDTREKLEADVREEIAYHAPKLIHRFGAEQAEMVLNPLHEGAIFEWLDRQADITERECREPLEADYVQSDKYAEMVGAYAELADKRDKLAHERDFWRAKCGMLLDAAHEMTRVGTMVDDNGEVVG